MSSFDPYREWLGLELAGRKPNFYELLNLSPSESDPAVIKAALDERTNRVRHVRPGANVEGWQKLLDELADARRCLTDVEQKQRYDQQLAGGVAPLMEVEVAPATSLNPLPPSAADLVMAAMPAPAVEPTPAPSTNPAVAPPSTVPGMPMGSPPGAPMNPAWGGMPGGAPYMPGYAPPGGGYPPQMPPGMPGPPMPQVPGGYGSPPGYPQPGAMPGYAPTYGPTGAPVAMAIPVSPSPYYGAMPPANPGAMWPAPPMPGYGMGAPPMGPMYGMGSVPAMNDPMAPVSLPETPDAFGPSYPGSAFDPGSYYDPAAQSPMFGGQGVGLAPVTTVSAPDEASPDVAVPHTTPQVTVARRREASQTRVVIGAVAALAGIVPLVFLLVYLLGDANKNSLADRGAGTGASTVEKTDPAPLNHSIPRSNETPAIPMPPVDPPEQKPVDPPPVDPKPDMPPEEIPKPVEKPEKPAPMPQPDPPKPERPSAVADMVRSLTAAKEALAKRNTDQAKVEVQVATNLAQTPEQKAMCDRLKSLTHFVGEFWKAVRESMKGLKGSEELQINNLVGIVVESSADSITIRVAGRNRTYDQETLPSGVAEVLADRWLDQKDPTSKVIKGAFYAVDPNRQNQIADAKRFWQEAQLAGADVEQLMGVLDDKYDVKSQAIVKQPPKKGPVPGPNVVATANAQLKSKFDSVIRAAKTPQQKYDLVRKMLEEAALPMDTEAARYALLVQARDIATNAKLVQIALECVDAMDQWFDIDVLKLKSEAVIKTAANPPRPVAKDIAMEALAMVDLAVEKKDLVLAERLAKTANGAARASAQQDLMKRTADRVKEVQKLMKDEKAPPPAKEADGKKPTEKKPADKKAGAK